MFFYSNVYFQMLFVNPMPYDIYAHIYGVSVCSSVCVLEADVFAPSRTTLTCEISNVITEPAEVRDYNH